MTRKGGVERRESERDERGIGEANGGERPAIKAAIIAASRKSPIIGFRLRISP